MHTHTCTVCKYVHTHTCVHCRPEASLTFPSFVGFLGIGSRAVHTRHSCDIAPESFEYRVCIYIYVYIYIYIHIYIYVDVDVVVVHHVDVCVNTLDTHLHVSIELSISLPVCLSVCRSIYLSDELSIVRFMVLSIHRSTYPSIYLSAKAYRSSVSSQQLTEPLSRASNPKGCLGRHQRPSCSRFRVWGFRV